MKISLPSEANANANALSLLLMNRLLGFSVTEHGRGWRRYNLKSKSSANAIRASLSTPLSLSERFFFYCVAGIAMLAAEGGVHQSKRFIAKLNVSKIAIKRGIKKVINCSTAGFSSLTLLFY